MKHVDDIEAQPLLRGQSEVASSSTTQLQPHGGYAQLPSENPAARDLSTTSQTSPRVCRFCFGEEGDAEDAGLGKMITPCLCRDVVHIECLKKWRESSSAAFQACNVCKFNYRFARLPNSQIFWIKITAPLYPLAFIFGAILLLGFWPIIAPNDGNFHIHLFNGFCALGLIYLCLLAVGFNVHYCYRAIAQAQAISGGAPLTREMWWQLLTLLSIRCLIVVAFFAFVIVFFFPLSAFMGAVFLCLVTPTAVKDFSDRLIRKLESNRQVLEMTAQMAAEAAAEMAQAAAAQVALEREREALLARDIEQGQILSHESTTTRGEYIELSTLAPPPPPRQQPLPSVDSERNQAEPLPSVDTLPWPGHHHSIMMNNHGSNIEEAIAMMRREHGSTVFLNLPLSSNESSSSPLSVTGQSSATQTETTNEQHLQDRVESATERDHPGVQVTASSEVDKVKKEKE